MKNKLAISLIAASVISSAAFANMENVEGLTTSQVVCDNGTDGFTIEIKRNNLSVDYSSCNIHINSVKEDVSADAEAGTVIATDGNFTLMDTGVVTCEGSAVGDTGTLNGTTYTTVDRDALVTMIDNGDSILGVCTSNITDMSYLFNENETFNESVSHFDTSNVTDMSGTFMEATIFNQPLDTWDTSNVTSMSGMFYYTEEFNQPLNDWDTSNVTDMYGVFSYAEKFNQPLDNWDTSSVTYMVDMFNGAIAFNQPIDTWDTSNVTDMTWMFRDATVFNQDISSWNVSSVLCFKGATALSAPDDFDYASGFEGQSDLQPTWVACQY